MCTSNYFGLIKITLEFCFNKAFCSKDTEQKNDVGAALSAYVGFNRAVLGHITADGF